MGFFFEIIPETEYSFFYKGHSCYKYSDQVIHENLPLEEAQLLSFSVAISTHPILFRSHSLLRFPLLKKTMETPTNSIKNPTDTTNNPSRTHHRGTITLIISLAILVAIIFAWLIFPNLGSPRHHRSPPHNLSLHHQLIKTACSKSPNPSLCFPDVSALPLPVSAKKRDRILHRVLEAAICHVWELVEDSRDNVTRFFAERELSHHEKNALSDCMDMLDQTVYELEQALEDLNATSGMPHRSYGNLKTLLSAAMTNENTCVDGFSDVEVARLKSKRRKGLRLYLEAQLSPVSRMISHCLAIVKHMEAINQKHMENQELTVRKPRNRYPQWMTPRERKMMEIQGLMWPDVVVARDGSGDYRTIGEAVMMALAMRRERFIIRIKAGLYKEKVIIPRSKINIMLVGDGMSSTVITGSRGFKDGYSTFDSATLTVVGDRFMARDLTILNTAGPDKHQAVAARVTSNAAFYRCNFSSYQDTLYAHSLGQFYRDCRIQGTIDFIFGNAAAIFQNCIILVRKPKYGQSNVITAQGREDANQNTGISMQFCVIQPAPEFSELDRRYFATYLGRPWRNHSRTIIMKSYLGDLVHPQGWCAWDKFSTLDTVEYIEYMNFGPGSDTRRRVSWGGFKKNCSEAKVRQFMVGAFLRGSGEWLEKTGVPLFPGP
ncbi:hypothetical protein Drorol1_Dr00005776 [Drosera rotundifolia]